MTLTRLPLGTRLPGNEEGGVLAITSQLVLTREVMQFDTGRRQAVGAEAVGTDTSAE